ncbi:oxalate decarboxylase family bicupin [Heyndrickxia ginsengihumi]|uniref:Oxalate decarboxylase n=1 Tax=Heyndrickxia ginsengihumi TaxID=363870 RepID=A0A0A6XVH6_9BACI|nr:oxalate decarboxylase family bicupin [Heyndrickxia ginsengihumi]KHD84192.1 oxalate decarboxylase [Heyndrickxia ginsengihumi]MBE6185157.1 cupin domain-containing protein [Bacillus sp. (in: firmicutes)]MCM3025083.1 oxalate decarboxylase family bicupin [Heyndrickxia ginsengihumi]NEY20815.1 oxalate decarboxylase family bicupin [Heyndrickxia ginsengihumi]
MEKRLNEQSLNRNVPQPIRNDGAGATDFGPRDVIRDLENPDMLISPATDDGAVPNLKFSYSDTHMQLKHGGWSREITVRELPTATALAGVNMRLTPGGVRELHWHKQSEWAYMILGHARITSVDQDGRNFIADVSAGDLWFFPAGIPHSIQGLEEGCEFLLVFDDGSFSEFDTFTITDWFAHTPKDVLAANFGVPESAFADIPTKQRYIFQTKVPGLLENDEVSDAYGTVPKSFTYRLHEQQPVVTPGGTVRIVDSTNFPISTTIAAALVEIKPGGMRELHWHPNADEWQYYLTGTGRMTVFAANGSARTFNYRAGDVGYVPFAMGHYIQNTGNQSLWFLEIFKSDHYADVSLNQWMALTPKELVQEHLNVGPELMNALRKEKWPVVDYRGQSAFLE